MLCWRIRLTTRPTSRVTATVAAATRTKVHQGEPLSTTGLVGVPVGGCGTEVGKPLPSFGETGEAAATLAAASSPRTVPTGSEDGGGDAADDGHGCSLMSPPVPPADCGKRCPSPTARRFGTPVAVWTDCRSGSNGLR